MASDQPPRLDQMVLMMRQYLTYGTLLDAQMAAVDEDKRLRVATLVTRAAVAPFN